MQTIVRSETREVVIDTEGPFTVIGEKINPTGRKKLTAKLQEGDYEYVRNLAISQVEAGADILDVNVGAPGIDEQEVLPAVAKIVAETVDVPLCLDSANREALAAALAVVPGRPLVNSVNGEEHTLDQLLPVVKEYDVPVIGLVMHDEGIPNDIETRVTVAEKIIERAAKLGIPSSDIVIDALVLTVGADSNAAAVTLGTVELVGKEFGVNISLGASNVSFGLPDRHVINQAFLGLAIGAGASAAITDPMKLTPTIRAADLLRGRDQHGARYIGYWREHREEEPA